MSRVGGVVLCGGRSSRMGRAKAWLPVGTEPMLQRVVRAVSEAVDPVVVVAGPGQDVPPLPADVRVVHDEIEGLGPLAGLAVGLAALEGRCDSAYLSACDVPFLRTEFVRRVAELFNSVSDLAGPDPKTAGDENRPPTVETRADICVPNVGGYLHPLAAVYHVSVLPQVRGLIAAGRLRPVYLFEQVPTRFVGSEELREADPDLRSLRNVNTPEEYENARAELGPPGTGPDVIGCR